MSAVEVKQLSSKPPVILLIENDESDVFLFRRALAKTGDVAALAAGLTPHLPQPTAKEPV